MSSVLTTMSVFGPDYWGGELLVISWWERGRSGSDITWQASVTSSLLTSWPGSPLSSPILGSVLNIFKSGIQNWVSGMFCSVTVEQYSLRGKTLSRYYLISKVPRKYLARFLNEICKTFLVTIVTIKMWDHVQFYWDGSLGQIHFTFYMLIVIHLITNSECFHK